MIAVDGDVCASMAGVCTGLAMRAGDEVVPGAQGMEAVTHPDYRNRPRLFTLAKQGRDLALERMQLMYTFPNARSIKLTKHVGAYLGEVGGWGIDLERRRLRLPRLGRRDEPAPATIDELAELAAQAHAQPDLVRIDKSPEWLAWRYSDATCENYEWVVERDGSGSLTAAALLGERDPVRWGADFAGIFAYHELLALDEQAARSVLRWSVEHARGAGARKLDVLVKDPMLRTGRRRQRLPARRPAPDDGDLESGEGVRVRHLRLRSLARDHRRPRLLLMRRVWLVLPDPLTTKLFFWCGLTAGLSERLGDRLEVVFSEPRKQASRWAELDALRVRYYEDVFPEDVAFSERVVRRGDAWLEQRFGFWPLAIRFNYRHGFHVERMAPGHGNPFLDLDHADAAAAVALGGARHAAVVLRRGGTCQVSSYGGCGTTAMRSWSRIFRHFGGAGAERRPAAGHDGDRLRRQLGSPGGQGRDLFAPRLVHRPERGHA